MPTEDAGRCAASLRPIRTELGKKRLKIRSSGYACFYVSRLQIFKRASQAQPSQPLATISTTRKPWEYSGLLKSYPTERANQNRNLPLQGSPIAIGPHGGKKRNPSLRLLEGVHFHIRAKHKARGLCFRRCSAVPNIPQSQAAGTTIRSCKLHHRNRPENRRNGAGGEGVSLMVRHRPTSGPLSLFPRLGHLFPRSSQQPWGIMRSDPITASRNQTRGSDTLPSLHRR